MTTKEEQDQRPLCRGARHTKAVLKQQTRFPGTLGRPLSLQPSCTRRLTSTRRRQLMPRGQLCMPRRGLLYGCQASRLWDLGCAVEAEGSKVHARSHPLPRDASYSWTLPPLSILISLGCMTTRPGTAANETTHSSHPYSGFDPLFPLSLCAQPTSRGAGGLLCPPLRPARLCLPQLVLPARDAHACDEKPHHIWFLPCVRTLDVFLL